MFRACGLGLVLGCVAGIKAYVNKSYSQYFPILLRAMGSLLLVTALKYKRGPYVHRAWPLVSLILTLAHIYVYVYVYVYICIYILVY